MARRDAACGSQRDCAVVTMLAMDIGMAIGIAIYLETVFRPPGLGRLALAALAGEVEDTTCR